MQKSGKKLSFNFHFVKSYLISFLYGYLAFFFFFLEEKGAAQSTPRMTAFLFYVQTKDKFT